jgi:hypothetical protein
VIPALLEADDGEPGSLVGIRTWATGATSMPRRARPTVNPQELTAALRTFLATESAGGAVLVVGAVLALVWANSPW